jgi:hypothetical protein
VNPVKVSFLGKEPRVREAEVLLGRYLLFRREAGSGMLRMSDPPAASTDTPRPALTRLPVTVKYAADRGSIV